MDNDRELFEDFWSEIPDVIASRKDDFADPALRRTLHLSKIYAHQAWQAARAPLLEKIQKLERPRDKLTTVRQIPASSHQYGRERN